jgi:1-pyrroline-5-carboxylate dehydrogenase
MLTRGNRRLFSSWGGNFKLPPITGEPMKSYAPGSPERINLVAALKQAKSEVVEIPVIINGKEYFTGHTFYQTMPSDHAHKLAKVHQATPELVQLAIETANTARKEWASMPFNHRAMIFRKAADLTAGKYRARINAATMLGQGKTAWQAEIDSAAESVDFLRVNTTFAEDIYNVQPPLNAPGVWNRLEYRELEGFVLAISPFNFTAIGCNLVAAPALMGNTVLWKPATTAVLANYVTYQIFMEAGMPAGVCSFLPGSGPVVGASINHPDFAGLHFTGSTATFNTLWKQIGNNLDNYKGYPRIVGETGGKNFHLLHPTCDLEHAALSTIRSAFEYQGQKCSACSRMYVPKSKWAEVKDKLLAAHSRITMGQTDDMSKFMSAVIDAKAFKSHTDYINGAHESPECEVIAGGKTDDSKGYFVEPTIIVTSNPTYKTMVEEIFGPVLTVYVYDDSTTDYWDEVMHLVDTSTQYGLTGAVFSRDRSAFVTASEGLRHACGNFYWNDKSTGAVVGEQPFGGARRSGTNDKAGSHLNLLRWTSARTVKENNIHLTDFVYPHMDKE